jgi:hypothetical protein
MTDNSERMREIAREITESSFALPRWALGDIVAHPDGYPVKILSGRLWEEFDDGGQRLVNHWQWKRVDARGEEFGAIESGVGWPSDPSVAHPSVGH